MPVTVIGNSSIRLVGLHFMAHTASLPLRDLFEGYCVALLALVGGMYLLT